MDSADRLLSSAIPSIRQPIESFFNWLGGLMVHVFGRIAAAFFLLVERVACS